MPKRTNDFQKLVLLIKEQLGAGATVTESMLLVQPGVNNIAVKRAAVGVHRSI